MTRVLIFANGELPNLEAARSLVHSGDIIICADGGTRHAIELGLTPDVIIGDLDSLLEGFQPSDKTQIIKFPADKNETDLELAIDHALSLKPEELIILAAFGGRLDQTLGNIALIANSKLLGCDVRLHDGVEEVFFCRDQVQVKGRSADIVSLIPWGGEVSGIVTEGLRWPLNNEILYPQKTRGISNEMLGTQASVKIKTGLLLIVHRSKNL
jgi:thiamine pyrophosphokinase